MIVKILISDQQDNDRQSNDSNKENDNTDIANSVGKNNTDSDDELSELFKRTVRSEDKDLASIQSREHLVTLQKQDHSLALLFKEALEKDFPNAKPYYYVKDGMLMHHDFHSKTLQEADQIVVPESLRHNILYLAHDIPASGHLGIAKTKARLWHIFIGLECQSMCSTIVNLVTSVKE